LTWRLLCKYRIGLTSRNLSYCQVSNNLLHISLSQRGTYPGNLLTRLLHHPSIPNLWLVTLHSLSMFIITTAQAIFRFQYHHSYTAIWRHSYIVGALLHVLSLAPNHNLLSCQVFGLGAWI
jgi:hypothetical protein